MGTYTPLEPMAKRIPCKLLPRATYNVIIRVTIRAGQNLPDKEFRYLRTVIVTAAVHWGLSSVLRLR